MTPIPSKESAPKLDIIERWRGAWELYNQGTESGSGANIRGIARIFLRSVFRPDTFPPPDRFPPKVDRVLAQRLAGKSEYSSLQPDQSLLGQAEKELIHRIIDLPPATVPQALETIDELAKISRLAIWTVGDVLKSKHELPEELVGTKDTLLGTGHQLWKLWKLGLTEKPDLDRLVADEKFKVVLPHIQKLEQHNIHRFVFMDDTFANLQKIKGLIDEENLQRAMTGDTPISYDLVLVNQGRKRIIPAPELSMKGSLGTYAAIHRFDQSTELIKDIKTKAQQEVGVFCDFDGVVTDNTAVRKEWDRIAQEVVEKVIERSTLRNPQKAKRGGEKLTRDNLTLEAIKDYIEGARKKGLRIGVKNGAYDIIQPGHIGGFDDAKAACDILIVMLNSDKSIKKYKGVKENVPRPLVSEIQRADVLLGLENVDAVVLFDEANPADLIRALRPDVYISSEEYRGKPLEEYQAVEEVGGEIIYTNIREGYSTSSIVRNIIQGFLGRVGSMNTESENAAKILKRLAGYV